MADWKDILSDSDEELKNDELINYVEDNLSEEEKHELEKKIVDSSFTNDAVEGLQTFSNKADLNQYVQQLNKDLHKQLAAKKQRKQKRMLKENPWAIITIVILLAICILGYYLVHLHYKNAAPKTPANTETPIKA